MTNMAFGLPVILAVVQLFFAMVIGMYFLNLWRTQQGNRVSIERESRNELIKLEKMRQVSLSEPLAAKTRPAEFKEIVGQEDGIKALGAALCSPNPQHVIIYGPPGVGKTAAARLVLEEARRNPHSPFAQEAKFVELDGATARFDERGIADPLIGSVHDPIYQGAGAMGMAGIPQPKPGAVTKAHGGILFIDEIGELHPIQINKLLKVLEDRRVLLESAYYCSEDTNIPKHIHDIFQKGLPADFRMVGATTRQPEEIPLAIRSRCVEVYFRELTANEIEKIASNAATKIGIILPEDALDLLCNYATNGRDAVNMIQIVAGLAVTADRQEITRDDVEWVINTGQYSRRRQVCIPRQPQVGLVNGLAVCGPAMGMLLEIEASVILAAKGKGQMVVTGVVDEEETGGMGGKRIRRKSLVRSSVENVLTLLHANYGIKFRDYDVHLNFPGGIPIDGPSAGAAMATAIYSAAMGLPVDNTVAITGELSIRGMIKPVGGVAAKVEAARQAGCCRVLIPKENWQQGFERVEGVEIIAVDRLEEVLNNALLVKRTEKEVNQATQIARELSGIVGLTGRVGLGANTIKH